MQSIQSSAGKLMDNRTTMPLRFEPIAECDIGMVEQWLDDPESRKRLGGMIPFRPCFEYQQAQPDYHEWIVYEGAVIKGIATRFH